MNNEKLSKTVVQIISSILNRSMPGHCWFAGYRVLDLIIDIAALVLCLAAILISFSIAGII